MVASPLAVPTKSQHLPVKATNWLENILFVAIPALVLVAVYYYISPALAQYISMAVARMLATTLLMIGLLVAAAVGFVNEGHPLTWEALATRFRLTGLSKTGWLWAAGGLVVYVALAVVANGVVPSIYKAIGFTPPIETAEPWGLSALPLVAIMLVLNILGEEIWWRGYLLPRQEAQFGKSAWLWHGILWAFFHVFKWWTIPAMLVVCPVVPCVAQRTRSTWPGMLLHFVVNGLGILVTVIQLLR